MRLLNVAIGRLSGLKYKLICYLKLAAHRVGDGIGEFVNDVN